VRAKNFEDLKRVCGFSSNFIAGTSIMKEKKKPRRIEESVTSTTVTHSTYTTESNSTNQDSQSVSSIPQRRSEDGKIMAGKYTYDQTNFWKGRIPGVRQTYPFPRSRPIIFHGKVVGLPTKFGPYAEYADGPPSPPPPTPVRKEIFPTLPKCCFSCSGKHKKRAEKMEVAEIHRAYGISTTDPYADLTLDTIGCDFCKTLEHHISPHFRYKKFQRRFIYIMLWMITLSYVPPLITLSVVLFVEPVHLYLMRLIFSYDKDLDIFLTIFWMGASFYLCLTIFRGKFRHRPWTIVAVLLRMFIDTVGLCSMGLWTERYYLINFSFTYDASVIDKKVKYETHLSDPLWRHSVGYWPAMWIGYQLFFRLTIAFTVRYTKIHFTDPEVSFINRLILWILFCFHGLCLFSEVGVVFNGHPFFDNGQILLGIILSWTSARRSLNNLRKLFEGRICAITEKEYLYCLLRLAN